MQIQCRFIHADSKSEWFSVQTSGDDYDRAAMHVFAAAIDVRRLVLKIDDGTKLEYRRRP